MHSIETRALPLLLLSLWVICFREHLYCVLCFALCFLHTHTHVQINSARAVALQTQAETSTPYINVRYISAVCSLLLPLLSSSSSTLLLLRHLSHETQRKFLAVKRAMLHISFTITFNYFTLFVCIYVDVYIDWFNTVKLFHLIHLLVNFSWGAIKIRQQNCAHVC